jgi:site-specific DNA-methyltransferase (adenine-specific)
MLLGEQVYSRAHYHDEDCVLINGDCKDIIKNIARPGEIQLIVTDPPYEFTASGGGLYSDSENMEQIKEAGTDTFDFDRFIPSMIAWQGLMSKVNAYFFCNKELIDRYIKVARSNQAAFDVLFMKKPKCPPAHNTHYAPDVEYVIFMKASGATFNGTLKEEWEGMYSKMHQQLSVKQNLLHPNQKPLDILKKFIIISSNSGDVIIDPFAGSAQTVKAARELGRYGIAIEKNPHWLEVAEANLSQRSLF